MDALVKYNKRGKEKKNIYIYIYIYIYEERSYNSSIIQLAFFFEKLSHDWHKQWF